MANPAVRGNSRVWLFDGGAGPTTTPELLAWGAAQSPDKSFGDVTRIQVPSRTARRQYDTVGEIQSGGDNATTDIMIRRAMAPSKLLKIANKRCIADFQVHFGNCTDPNDFLHGWADGWVTAYERGRITTYGSDELGSLQEDDESPINETITVSANEFYEIGPLSFAERAKSEVAQEIVKILVCDGLACGDCEDPSDGCQKVFAVSAPAGSSPGLIAEVVVSNDGMSTIVAESPITTLSAAEDPDDAACVGDNLVVVSEASGSIHYADIDELIAGTETWAEIATGIVSGGEPRAIDSYSPFATFVGGAGGYIYKSTDPTNGVTVLDAGVATTEDINDIYAFSDDVVVAVGDNNAVVYTVDGSTFQSVTGPAVGVNLLAVYVREEREWWVGSAGGKLYFTKNRGQSWTEKTFNGSGAGTVDDIVFASKMVGYAVHATATPAGRVLRTIDGGASWYVLPDVSTALPASDKLNSIALCEKDVNTVFAAGLADNGADGVILKGTTSYQ